MRTLARRLVLLSCFTGLRRQCCSFDYYCYWYVRVVGTAGLPKISVARGCSTVPPTSPLLPSYALALAHNAIRTPGLPTQDDQWSWWGILKGVPLVKNLKPLVDNIAPSDTFNANVEALLKRNLGNLLGKGSENGSNYWRLNPPLGNVGFTGDKKSIETMKKGMADYLADGTASGGGTKLDEICEMLNLPTYRGAARYYTLLVPFTALSIIAYIFPSGMLSFLSDEGVGGSVAPEL